MKVRSYLFLFLPTLFISIITTGEIQPPPGAEPTPVLELDFNSPWMRELIARCPHARVEGDVLTVEVPAVPGKPMRETAWVVVPLDLKKLGATGRTIQVRMEATFSNVTEPDKKYLGAKGMLAVTDAATGKTVKLDGALTTVDTLEAGAYAVSVEITKPEKNWTSYDLGITKLA